MHRSTNRLLFSGLVFAVFCVQIGAAATPTLDSEQWAFLTLINNLRNQHGVGPLQVSVALQNSSQWMSTDMAAKNYFSHTDSLGRDPYTRMAAFGYQYGAAENVAAGNSDAQSTFDQFATACDPDGSGNCTYAHLQNMLNGSLTVIGIGRAFNAGALYRWYWTTDFGTYVDQTITPGGPVNVAPTADSVTPNTGSGASQSFTFKYSSANGYQYLNTAYALINTNLTGAAGCVPVYLAPTNALYLYNDAGTAFLGPLTPGSGGTLSNSQCTVNLSGSSAIGSGNTLSLTLAVAFNAAFKGTQTLYGYATDQVNLNSGWQTLGSWAPSVAQVTPPTADSVTPSSGSATAQNFTFKYSSVNGYKYISAAYTLINNGLSGVAGCVTYYLSSNNSLYLFNDAGNSLTGPLVLGGAGTLSNSQCMINGAGSSATGAGNTLSLALAVTFNPAVKGMQTVYGYALDTGGLNSGWKQLGTWTLNAAGNTAPTADSVTPNAGSGPSQSFTFKYSSGSGYQNINSVWALINGTLTPAGGCVPVYLAAGNALYLFNDSGTAITGPLTPGSSGTLSNSQCTIYGTGSSASGAGNTLSLTVSLTFNRTFKGTQTLYGYASDNASLNSGWTTLGNWTAF